MPRYCEICKLPIGILRAKNLPQTKLCREHAGTIRQFGGEFIRVNEEERSNKADSLKKNVSGVKTRRVRNIAALEKLKEKWESERWAEEESVPPKAAPAKGLRRK